MECEYSHGVTIICISNWGTLHEVVCPFNKYVWCLLNDSLLVAMSSAVVNLNLKNKQDFSPRV